MQREKLWMAFSHLTRQTQVNILLCSLTWSKRKIKKLPLLFKYWNMISNKYRTNHRASWLMNSLTNCLQLLTVSKRLMLNPKLWKLTIYILILSFHSNQWKLRHVWLIKSMSIKIRVSVFFFNLLLDIEDNYSYNLYMGIFEGFVILSLAFF